jgi:hypothetical protein
MIKWFFHQQNREFYGNNRVSASTMVHYRGQYNLFEYHWKFWIFYLDKENTLEEKIENLI